MAHQIVTANRLIDGAVVYLSANETWSPWIGDAHVLEEEQTANAALASGFSFAERNEVIDPYLVDVVRNANTLVPLRYREIIRAKGPSTRPQELRQTVDQLPPEQIPLSALAMGTLTQHPFV